MTPQGTVVALGTAAGAGAPIESRQSIDIEIASGVVGDRYADGSGHWQGFPDQEVTLVEAEDAEAQGIEPLKLRRNIVTRGVSLESLVGRAFTIGSATLHGMRPCRPCMYLEGLTHRPGLKETLRGGLRARVVRRGTVRVGDSLRETDVVLDEDMRAVIASAHLAFVATVTAAGLPNLSPKGTIRVLDDRHLFFIHIDSPQTRKNLATNPAMEINVVDIFSRRGYRFLGPAEVHANDDVARRAEAQIAAEEGHRYPNHGVVVLRPDRILPLVSPGYETVKDEWEMRTKMKAERTALDQKFEAHLRSRGPLAGEKGPQ
ncbi:MAG: pyridoxamine 5'-phosphate oxidase family protein [Thermoplasmatota archaeon]